MAISWGTIKSLLIFFGPILLPKAISYYRSVRAAPRVHGLTVQPAPPAVQRTLVVLALVAATFLVATLPVFAPENIFALTQSRLQIPTDVLFARLSALRPGGGALTPADEALRARFVNLESRLLYLQHGPDPLATCPFCTADDPRSYLWYALPALLAPHLANLVVLAAATSSFLSGAPAARWRSAATVAALLVAALDLYIVQGYNHQANARALRLPDLDAFFWRARALRLLALAGLDALVGLAIWLAATNRAFGRAPSPAERVAAAVRVLAEAKTKLHATTVFKNVVMRDDELRARHAGYWWQEAELVRSCMEEREVIEGVNDALQNRLDIGVMSRDADKYALHMVEGLGGQGMDGAAKSE